MKTAPIQVTYLDHCGSDLSTVNAARVSFANESDWDDSELVGDECDGWSGELKLKEKDAKLIKYLADHKHLSPFNHAFLSVRIKVPIFIARQLVKHSYMPWNEESRRYIDEEPEFYIPTEYRKKAENVKQGSSDELVDNQEYLYSAVASQTEAALETYNFLLSKGVCPEQARMVLPVNTMTEIIWSGTLGAFAKMLSLRLAPHTQKEARDVAIPIYDIVNRNFPVSLQALLNRKQ